MRNFAKNSMEFGKILTYFLQKSEKLKTIL